MSSQNNRIGTELDEDVDEDAQVLSFTSPDQHLQITNNAPRKIPPPKLDLDDEGPVVDTSSTGGSNYDNDAYYPENYADADKVNRYILAWEFLSRWGDQMWFFTVPMVLIGIFSTSIMPPAVYATATKLTLMLFANNIGSWLDQQSRSKVMHISLVAQMASLIGAGVFIYFLVYQLTENAEGYNSMTAGISFLCLVICSIIGSLGSIALNKSIESDWLPAITPGVHLVSLKESISRIALVCEILAPLFVALVLISGWHKSFITVVTIFAFMYIPQYVLLHLVVKARPQLYQASNKTEIRDAMSNPFSVIWKNKSQLNYQGAGWFVMGKAFISFNIMSAQNLVFIAFLSWYSVPYVAIAMFLGSYALLGSSLLGNPIFHPLVSRFGVARASTIYLLYVIAVLVIALASLATHGIGYILCIFVALSAFGVHGYKRSHLRALEENFQALPGADDRRKSIGELDSALESLSVLLVYSFAIFNGNPSKFIVIVGVSFACIVVGFILNLIWNAKSRGRSTPPVVLQY